MEPFRGPVSIRWGAVAIYVFTMLLVHLGRIHIGGLFHYMLFLLIVIPPLSFIHLALSVSALKYNQEFDTDHPTKGENLTYTLLIANESYLGSPRIRISFTTVQPGLDTKIEPLDFSLKRGQRLEKNYTISCPFRGIYTVGLNRMVIDDLLGFIRISRPVWHTTFYVYPRVIEGSYPFTVGDVSDLSTGPNPGASQDYSLFESLVPYRNGESVRHIAWKKFFALGEPYLKSYARTSQPGISIYFDLRRDDEPVAQVLETEDCSVEILVSLVKFFLDRDVPVSVHAMGQSRYRFAAEARNAFELFHKDTINLLFTHTISPAEMFHADTQEMLPRSSVLFITHRMDPEIIAIMEDTLESHATDAPEVACIVNQSNMESSEIEACRTVFNELSEKGARALLVRGSDSLNQDLRRIS